jgi:hypothetical protein
VNTSTPQWAFGGVKTPVGSNRSDRRVRTGRAEGADRQFVILVGLVALLTAAVQTYLEQSATSPSRARVACLVIQTENP